MKKFNLAMLALVLVCGLALVGCDNGTNGGGEERSSVIYSGVSGNAIYTLTISPPRNLAALADDDHMLVVNRSTSTKISVGKVKEVNNDTFVLLPSVENAPTFSITTSDE
jgi:predicted small secreted protein